VFDLIGNVWEWTSSPYLPLKGFKENEYRVKAGRDGALKKLAIWDADKRVTVGGSFAMDQHIARASVRAEAARSDRRNALGFRAAASTRAGEDIAEVLSGEDVRRSDFRPDGVTYLPSAAVAMDHWRVAPSSASSPPAGYQVILGYDYVMFVPAEMLVESQEGAFERSSLEAPIHLGFFASSMPMKEPALDAGVYFVAYRAKGDPPRVRTSDLPEEGAPVESGPGIETLVDVEQANFIFYSAATGEFAGALPVGICKFDKAAGAGSLNFIDQTVWETITGEDGTEQKVQKVEKRLVLDVGVATPIRNRVLQVNLVMNAPQELAGQAWRR
jgi:hypothetical protein